MACKYQISIVDGNDFALVFPLKRRTYVNGQPVDEMIDATRLQNVVLKIGGVQVQAELGTDGVRTVIRNGSFAVGTYDIVLTAKYQGGAIRAAYFEALVFVQWDDQSDAQLYLPGSPLVMDAAFVIGGALTDAELQELKQQAIEATEDAREAEAAAAAKEGFDQAAENLGNLPTTLVQQERTIYSQQGTINAQNTLIGQLSGGVVMMSEDEYAPALADLASKLN